MARAVAVLVLLAPFAALADCEREFQLRQLIAKDPVELANAAASHDDLKFLGVAGYAVSVPGVDIGKCTVRSSHVRVLEGTSDTPCDLQLQGAAREFALKYNAVIKAKLDAKRVKYEACAP